MIDDKTIERAARNYYLLEGGTRKSFKAGAEWFRIAIWHDKDEIPAADRLILIKDWKCKDGYITFHTTEELCLKDFDKEIQWKHFCELADANFTWCYIDDLLPRRGGQEDD